MKIIQFISILLIGCTAFRMHAGGPAGTISEEVGDMTAESVGRNVGNEVGEIADETAQVTNRRGFVFHKPKTEIPPPPLPKRITSEPIPEAPVKPVLRQTVSEPPPQTTVKPSSSGILRKGSPVGSTGGAASNAADIATASLQTKKTLGPGSFLTPDISPAGLQTRRTFGQGSEQVEMVEGPSTRKEVVSEKIGNFFRKTPEVPAPKPYEKPIKVEIEQTNAGNRSRINQEPSRQQPVANEEEEIPLPKLRANKNFPRVQEEPAAYPARQLPSTKPVEPSHKIFQSSSPVGRTGGAVSGAADVGRGVVRASEPMPKVEPQIRPAEPEPQARQVRPKNNEKISTPEKGGTLEVIKNPIRTHIQHRLYPEEHMIRQQRRSQQLGNMLGS